MSEELPNKILKYLEYKLKDSMSGTYQLQKWTQEIVDDVKLIIESE